MAVRGIHELAQRISDGVEVTLFYDFDFDRMTCRILDFKDDNCVVFEVKAKQNALAVFNHPWAFAPKRETLSV